MNYNIYRISRDKWNKVVNNHSRQHHNPPSGNQIYMGRKAKRRDSSVKLWKQQSEKRNASESKLNIFTSIQCVVSKGIALGKLGGKSSLETAHSEGFVVFFLFCFLFLLLKRSQNNKQFGADSLVTQNIPKWLVMGF